MGGFAGGDEGGYWEDDITNPMFKKRKSKDIIKDKSFIKNDDSGYSIKSYAKASIFFKITGFVNNNYTISSRYVILPELYDTIKFVPYESKGFSIEGYDKIQLEESLIYKAYKLLDNFTGDGDTDIVDFFKSHKVVITKSIPTSIGLGSSSSNLAAFMKLVKEACNVMISTDELIEIGSKIKNDMAFFIYDYDSANISGFGEIVNECKEEAIFLKLHINKSNHNKVFENNYSSSFEYLEELDSKSILKLNLDPISINDLYDKSITSIKKVTNNKYFYSGFGSSYFTY